MSVAGRMEQGPVEPLPGFCVPSREVVTLFSSGKNSLLGQTNPVFQAEPKPRPSQLMARESSLVLARTVACSPPNFSFQMTDSLQPPSQVQPSLSTGESDPPPILHD